MHIWLDVAQRVAGTDALAQCAHVCDACADFVNVAMATIACFHHSGRCIQVGRDWWTLFIVREYLALSLLLRGRVCR
jgi:hypothetical protein